jgi:RHS repeat-associated protein
VYVVGLASIDRSKLGLEDYFSYDSAETGAGTSLHVNAANGNVVWHSQPVVNKGRGLSTALNLTYNSHDRGGFLGSLISANGVPLLGATARDLVGMSYGEVGAGFSLGVGISRLNEPLAGVGLNDLGQEISDPSAITLTDRDGTAHTFRKDTANPGWFLEPAGVHLRLRKYPQGNAEKRWAFTRPDGVTFFYNSLGYQTFITDRDGNSLRFEYEKYSKATGATSNCAAASPAPNLLCAPRVVRIVDAAGVKAEPSPPVDLHGPRPTVVERRSVRIEYNPNPVLPIGTSTLLPAQLSALVPVGGKPGRIARIIDHGCRTTEFGYEDGYLKEMTQGRVLVRSSSTYKCTSDYKTMADSRTIKFDYDGTAQNKLLDDVKDAMGRSTQLDYDDAKAPGPFGTRSVGRRPDSVLNRRNFRTEFQFGSTGFTATAPGQRPTHHMLDSFGRPTTIRDALGTETELHWDTDNNVDIITEAANFPEDRAITKLTWNGNGQITRREDAEGRVTQFSYCYGTENHHADPASCPAPGSAGPHPGYVADLTKVLRAEPNTNITYGIDARGHVTSRQYDGYRASTSHYDPVTGLKMWDVDEQSNTTTYANHDENGLPWLVKDGRGNAGDPKSKLGWRYSFDELGNVRTATDPRGANDAVGTRYTADFDYDAFDRLTVARTPRSQTANGLEWTTRRASFDKNGNLSTTTDGKELVTTRRYTANDQIEFLESPAVAHAESGDQVAPEIAKYVYDERDNLTVIESPNGQATATVDDYTTRIDYDLADRPVKQSRLSRGGTASPDRITSYDYDRRGNVIGVADPRRNATGDPLQNARDNRRWHYVYDLADNRVEQVEDPGPGPDDENLRTMSIFDANGRVKEIRSPRFFKEPNNYRFATFLTYDSRDQLLTRSEGRGELYAGDADTRTTTYDRRHDGRVVKVTSPRGNRTSQVDFQTTYGYDQNGDLMTVTLPKAGMTHESDQTSMVFTRDAVGNPEKITDFRGFEVTNEFYDGGELRSTNRPSMWKLALGSAAEGGDEVTLKPWEEWGDHAGDPELPATEGNGDFGAVGAAPSPGILPKAGTTTFFYDREMQLTSVRDVANKSVEIARDEVGRVVKISHPFGQEAPTSPHVKIHNSFRYDFNGNLREFVDGGDSPGDEDGYVTKTAYDQFDLPVEVDAPGAARDLDSMAQIPRAITKTEYDENGNALKIFGPEPDVEASFTYDGFDRLSWEEDGEDDVTTYGYDSGGNQTCVAPPKANPDTVRPPQACQAGRYATIRTFDQFGQLSEERRTPQNAGEIVSTFKYDHDGNLTRETLPGAALVPGGDVVNHVIDRTYDGRGLPHTESMFEGEPDPGQRGRWIKVTEYDPNGNLRRTIGKSGLYEIETGRWEPYGDPDNNLAVEPDVEATQRATVNVYNADNLIISQWRPTDSSTGRPQDEKRYHQDYNRNGRGHIESIDAAREGTSRVTRTQYAHYDNGWIEYSTDKYSTSDSNDQFNNAAHFEYTYDGRGNQLSWLTDMREVTRSFYPNGLLRTKTAEAFVGDAKSRTYDHVYNANRSLVGMRQRNGRETLVGRDKNDRVLSVLENWEGGKDTKFKYDAHGNVTQRRTDGEVDLGPNLYSGGKLTTFEYDDADRETLMRVQQSGQAEPREWETKWFPSGAMRERTKPNDTVESWTYYAGDITHHMRRRVKNPPAGDPYAKNIEYEYDADGQRTKDERGTYEYDARDQLVTWKRNDKKVGETTVQGTTVTYEHTGNGAVRRKVDDGEVTTYEFTKGDRLDYVVDDGDRWDYRHNDLGDVTKIEPGEGVANAVPTNYEYDALGRLEFAHDESTGTKGERYAYDALDRRDWKCDATSAIAACETNTRSEFVYLGLSEKTTGERQVSEETSGTKTTRSKTYDYSSALQRLGQDRITEKEQQAPTNVFRSYAHDVQGSVEGLESGDGAINKDPQKGEVTAYEYDPYGAVVNQEDLGATAKANPFRFQGFYYDDATETYDMQARAYRAPLGRFLSSDRYESAYGDLSLQLDPLTQNRYAFGSGNPVGNVELDGHIGGMAGAVDGNGKTGRSARRNLIKAQRASPLTFSAPATDQEGAQAAVNNRARAANYPAAQSGQLKVVSTRREGAKVFAKLQGAPNSGSYFETQIMHGRALQLPRRQEASNPSPVAMGIIAVGCALLCPDVTDVPGAVGSVIKPVRIADRAVDAVGDLAKGLDDAAEQATRHDERVSVYHGSIHDSRAIRDGDGLDPAKAPSTVTRDRRASENAIDPYARPNDLPFRDPGIVESRIPRDIFDELFAPLERPYPGFHDRPILSTEIQMRSPEQFKAFNTYRVR